MLEDRVSLESELLRTHRYSHLDVINIPLCPGTSVHPDAAVLKPCFTLQLIESREYGISSYAVCAMWVAEVSGHEDHMWLDPLDEVLDDQHILLRERLLLNGAGLIEGEVKEVDVVIL